MAGIESRGGIRVPFEAGCVLEIDKAMQEGVRLLSGPQKATVFDISVIGVGVYSPIFFPKGVILEIKVDSPQLKSDVPIKIKGEVRYCKPEGKGKYRLGVKFIDVEERVLSKIREYVAKNEKSVS